MSLAQLCPNLLLLMTNLLIKGCLSVRFYAFQLGFNAFRSGFNAFRLGFNERLLRSSVKGSHTQGGILAGNLGSRFPGNHLNSKEIIAGTPGSYIPNTFVVYFSLQ